MTKWEETVAKYITNKRLLNKVHNQFLNRKTWALRETVNGQQMYKDMQPHSNREKAI